MLQSLTIKSIALIDNLTVCFSNGFNVLTGETGAGKSIIVDALTLLLGGKFQKELIRTGAQKAYVEGTFTLSDCPLLQPILKEELLIEDTSESIILSREVNTLGRSICRIEGVHVPLQKYREVTARLMDIHGQHEHQSLMQEKNHLTLLDDYGDKNHLSLLESTKTTYQIYHKILEEKLQLEKKLAQKKEMLDLWRFQKKEIEQAKLTLGEEDALKNELQKSRYFEKIKEKLSIAYDVLYEGDEESPALSLLKRADEALNDILSYDDTLSPLKERINSLYYETEDIALTIKDKMHALEYDDDAIDKMSARLDVLKRLFKKHGASSKDVLDKLDEINQNLSMFENADDSLCLLLDQLKKAQKAFDEQALLLSNSRHILKQQLEESLEKQLSELNMKGTRFEVCLSSSTPSSSGVDACVFMIAPNRGEKLQSLAQTASGGELSRLMLALKSITASKSLIPSMVFDEIDTGISGRTAQVVAEKIADIARFHQVLCVTHLTQIAAMAHEQYLVQKEFDGERTLTHIKHLSLKERTEILATMLSGSAVQSQSALKHAKELLKDAKDYYEQQ